MKTQKYDPILAAVEDAMDAHRAWKLGFAARVKAMQEAEERAHADAVSKAAITAINAGKSKLSIKRALKNLNADNLERILSREVGVDVAPIGGTTRDTHDAPHKIEKGYEYPNEWYLHYSALRGSDYIGGVLVRVQDGEIEIHPSTLTDESTRVVEGSKNAVLRMIAEEEANLAPEPVTEWEDDDDPFAEE